MYLRAYPGKKVVRVEVCRPHGLVVICQKPYIGMLQNAPYPGRCGEGPDLAGDFVPGAHHDMHIAPRHPFYRTGAFKRPDQGTRAEIIYEIILVDGILECHPALCDIDKYHGHLRHVPEKPYPCEILRPGKEFGYHEIHFGRIEHVHGADCVFPFVNHTRIHQIQEVQLPDNLFHIRSLPLTIGASGKPFAQVLEPRGSDKQQTGFRLPVFLDSFHCIILSLKTLNSFLLPSCSPSGRTPCSRQASLFRIPARCRRASLCRKKALPPSLWPREQSGRGHR